MMAVVPLQDDLYDHPGGEQGGDGKQVLSELRGQPLCCLMNTTRRYGETNLPETIIRIRLYTLLQRSGYDLCL